MNKEIKILIDENPFDFSIQISKYLTKKGYAVFIKHNNEKTLYSEIMNISPNVVILNSSLFNGDLISFIKHVRENTNDKVHMIILMPYTHSKYTNLIYKSGASYLQMPFELHQLHEEISIKNNFTSHTLVSDKIEYFVENFGIKRKYKGFKYICCIMYIMLFEHDQFKGLTKNIYPETARRYNTNYQNIERCIRNSIKNFMKINENRVYISNLMNEENPKVTNSRFLKVLTDNFKRYYLKN